MLPFLLLLTRMLAVCEGKINSNSFVAQHVNVCEATLSIAHYAEARVQCGRMLLTCQSIKRLVLMRMLAQA